MVNKLYSKEREEIQEAMNRFKGNKMTYYILRTKDISTNETERIDLIISSVNKDSIILLIKKFQKEKWDRKNCIDLGIEDFIEYLHKKGVDVKLLDSEDIIFNEYDNS